MLWASLGGHPGDPQPGTWGLLIPPEQRDAQKDMTSPPTLGRGPKQALIIFEGLFGCKSGCHHSSSTPDSSDSMAGWGCGGSGGNHPQNPSAAPPMKYSGCSAQFPPCCRRKHHQYCRWALKFQGCHVSGHCQHGKSLRRDVSHLRQAPVTSFSLVYPKNWWW